MDNINTIAVNKNTTINSIINSFARRGITEKDKIGYVKVLLLKIILQSIMEDLKETNIYQKGIKKSGNEFLTELRKGIFDERYFNLLGSDAPAVEEMERSIELMADQISSSTLGCFAVITETLKKYQECPDFVLERLNIMKGESKQIKELEYREGIINDIIKLPLKAMPLVKQNIEGLKNIYPLS